MSLLLRQQQPPIPPTPQMNVGSPRDYPDTEQGSLALLAAFVTNLCKDGAWGGCAGEVEGDGLGAGKGYWVKVRHGWEGPLGKKCGGHIANLRVSAWLPVLACSPHYVHNCLGLAERPL